MSSSDRLDPLPDPPPSREREPVAPGGAGCASSPSDSGALPEPLGATDSLSLQGGGSGRGCPANQPTRRLFLLAPLALAACGFAPAYGPSGSAGKLTETVWVQDPTDKRAFDLVERLEERLGRPENIRFDLAYTITTETVGVGITTDNKITRYNLKGVVDYTLTDRATGTRVTGGRVQSFTAYSATGSTVAGLAAEEDAALRLMRILADQIVARLIAASASLP